MLLVKNALSQTKLGYSSNDGRGSQSTSNTANDWGLLEYCIVRHSPCTTWPRERSRLSSCVKNRDAWCTYLCPWRHIRRKCELVTFICWKNSETASDAVHQSLSASMIPAHTPVNRIAKNVGSRCAKHPIGEITSLNDAKELWSGVGLRTDKTCEKWANPDNSQPGNW